MKKFNNIGIIPTVREIRENQIEYSVDKRIFSLLSKIFTTANINILYKKKKLNEDLIISLGGNTILSFSDEQRDLIRSKLDSYFLKESIKKKIPYVGICYGAQFIANKYGALFEKDYNHVGKSHIINFKEKKFLVNSFHEFKIKKINKNFTQTIKSNDGSIEFFNIKKTKIYGVMWHPERNKKLNNIDKIIFKTICS